MSHFSRRQALRAGLPAALLHRSGGAQPARLDPVESLSATFLVDGAVNGFQQAAEMPGLTIAPAPRTPRVGDRLVAEWGLSLLLQSQFAGAAASAMMDFGYSPEALGNNMCLLGLDPALLDALVLTHGHHDHFGGLQALLGRVRRGTPLYVGGEEALCRRLRGLEGNLDFGRLDADAARAGGIDLRIEAQPARIGGGITTGAIPLTIERPKTPTRMLPGEGCARERLDLDKRGLDVVQDDIRHELGLIYHVAGLGLIVFGSCSHRGILNTVARARDVSGVAKVHAIVGGFHLVPPQTPADALRTAEAMAALDPAYVVPGHCSGETFIAAATALMPGRVIRPYVGTTFVFRA